MVDADMEFECPTCKKPMEKVFDVSNTSFELKGSGWFKTDGKY
jgi:predicted nucleic acid-binding Zn ribbon protein